MLTHAISLTFIYSSAGSVTHTNKVAENVNTHTLTVIHIMDMFVYIKWNHKSGLITIVGEPVAGDDLFGQSERLQIWSLGYKKRFSAREIDRFYCGEQKINNADHAAVPPPQHDGMGKVVECGLNVKRKGHQFDAAVDFVWETGRTWNTLYII